MSIHDEFIRFFEKNPCPGCGYVGEHIGHCKIEELLQLLEIAEDEAAKVRRVIRRYLEEEGPMCNVPCQCWVCTFGRLL